MARRFREAAARWEQDRGRGKGLGEAGSEAGLGVWGSARAGRGGGQPAPWGILLWRPLPDQGSREGGGRAREGWAQLVGPGAELPDRLPSVKPLRRSWMGPCWAWRDGTRTPEGPDTQWGKRGRGSGRCWEDGGVWGGVQGLGRRERDRDREKGTHPGVGRGRCPWQRRKQSPPQGVPGLLVAPRLEEVRPAHPVTPQGLNDGSSPPPRCLQP